MMVEWLADSNRYAIKLAEVAIKDGANPKLVLDTLNDYLEKNKERYKEMVEKYMAIDWRYKYDER